jgi:hypothetical protein
VARVPGRELWRAGVEELREVWQRGLAEAWALSDAPIGARR